METLLAKMTKEIANLRDDMQVQLFCTVVNLPAITFPILRMTSNELAVVFESSCGVPFEKPTTLKQTRRGESSGTVNPTFERCTRAARNRAVVEAESSDGTEGTDKEL